MLYLYGVIDRSEMVAPTGGGLDGAPVRALPWRDLVVAVSGVDQHGVPATEDNLWRHEHVIEALMTGGTVLPMRFGTIVADEAACRRRITELHDSLRADLARVRGSVEFGLRVTAPAPAATAADEADAPSAADAVSAAGVGTAYIRERLRAHRRQAAARQRVAGAEKTMRSWLDPCAADTVVWPDDPPNAWLRASFLVRKGCIPTFLQAVTAFQRHQPAFQVSCTGPWPPYSFIRTRMAAATAAEVCHA